MPLRDHLSPYAIGVITAASRLANALRGGDPDESLSYVAAMHRDEPGWRLFGAVLDWFDAGHRDWATEEQAPPRPMPAELVQLLARRAAGR